MLKFYNGSPFTAGTQLDPVDTYTGTGVATTFSLSNKSAVALGGTIQFANTQYLQYSNGFTKNTGNNTFTLSSVPALGTQGVAPGASYLSFAAYDNDSVTGVTNPRIDEQEFYLCDVTTINLYKYENYPGLTGIAISLSDLVSGFGASTSWCQLACSAVDGTALTYQATGTTLYTNNINGFGSTNSTVVAGASSLASITTSNINQFVAGDYVIVNIGASSQEVMHISSIVSTTLNFDSGFNFGHIPGESIYVCGRKFWCKITVPANTTSNTAYNFIDLGLRRYGRIRAR